MVTLGHLNSADTEGEVSQVQPWLVDVMYYFNGINMVLSTTVPANVCTWEAGEVGSGCARCFTHVHAVLTTTL